MTKHRGSDSADQVPNQNSYFDLTDEKRAMIRAEEIYREEVRKQLTTSKDSASSNILKFANSPLGIYVLSSILLGGITYLYTRHQEHLQSEKARILEVVKLDDEIQFRERQVNEALAIVVAGTKKAKDMGDRNSAFDALAYRVQCEELSIAVRLGGIVFPPGDPNGTESRYRDLIVDNNLLLFRQGYKSPDYKYVALADLGIKKWKLSHGGHDPLPSRITSFDQNISDLDDSAYALVREVTRTGAYGPSGEQTSDPLMIARGASPIIGKVQKEWQAVLAEELISSK
jgi:hypothetical protein